MSAVRDFALPDLGEGLTESEIVAWRVAVGDRIELNQIVADVETAKAVVEIPSPFAGVVTALHAEPGDTVDVGAPLFSCDTGEQAPDAGAPAPGGRVAAAGGVSRPAADPSEAPRSEAAGPALVGYGAAAESGSARRARPGLRSSATVLEPPAPDAGAAPLPETRPAERPRSTPPVRKLARDLGVDLETVTGTGERGLITRADVEAAAPAASTAPSAAPTGAAAAPASGAEPLGEERIPIRGVRKHTAAAMVASAFTAPHVTEFLTVDVSESMRALERFRAAREFEGVRVTPLALVAKAVCLAARRTPEVNSRWDEAAGEIVRFDGINLGIAAATERGLVVPNVKRADRLALPELARAIAELADTARAGRSTPADLAGGTMTITNIGVFGIDAGTPILNPGEAAILAMGAVRRMPWEHEGQVALREVMTLSLSFDHRLVDGAQGSRFLADVGRVLADPAAVLAMV